MVPIWSYERDEYYITVPFENQTFYMAFQEEYRTLDTVYFNVQMALFDKRKEIHDEEIKTTGKLNPIRTFQTATKVFKLLEETCYREFNGLNVVIYIRWADNRRRDIYYKYLSRLGYRYGRDYNNEKCLFKKNKKLK